MFCIKWHLFTAGVTNWMKKVKTKVCRIKSMDREGLIEFRLVRLAHNFNYIKHYIKLYSNNLFGWVPIHETFLLCCVYPGTLFLLSPALLCLSYHPFYSRMAKKQQRRVHKCIETVFNHLAPYPEWIKTRKFTQWSHFPNLPNLPTFTCWYFVVLNEDKLAGYIQQKLKRLSSSVHWNWNFANGVIDRKTNSMKNVFEKS